MNHIGLFEGIGGFSLAARWMGWKTIAWCEWNSFCQQVLKYHFPNARQHGNITETDFTIYRGQCDILTGGFPCQPYSVAGKRKGKEDERHLWPEMLRAIREVQPRWIVGENVFGLVNWSGGLVFHEVQTDLEAEGYEVWPYVLPACGKNAPHRRDRIWFVAYSTQQRLQYRNSTKCWQLQNIKERLQDNGEVNRSMCEWDAANSERLRQLRSGWAPESSSSKTYGDWKASWVNPNGRRPTISPICNGDDGISTKLDATSISKTKWNKSSLEAGGNAIVPQVAYEIFKAIEAAVQAKEGAFMAAKMIIEAAEQSGLYEKVRVGSEVFDGAAEYGIIN